MKGYTTALQEHLGHYATARLGVTERGLYNGQPYSHILPPPLKYLNLLESARSEIQAYLDANRDIKLHRYFHHLNSSQAFAFNFFYPYFAAAPDAQRVLSAQLGVDSPVSAWIFEAIPNAREGTNVDVFWAADDGPRVFCEVKLSEAEFGQAPSNEERELKLETIYRPRLRQLVSDELLTPGRFFKHYQLLRNISLLAERPEDHLVFLFPRENEALKGPLEQVLNETHAVALNRIHVVHIEDCVDALERSAKLSPALRVHAAALREKYVI